MTDRAAAERPDGRGPDDPDGSAHSAMASDRLAAARPYLTALAAAVFVAALVPPLSSRARHVEVLEALQFALLAFGVPALVVLGAPWRSLGLSARLLDKVAAARRRHPEPRRSAACLAFEAAVVVAWRIPVSVDALARHGWLSLVEGVTLVGVGIALWLELVESPPFAPRLARPRRIVVAAVAMWTIWVAAYLLGLSHTSVYRAYAHVAGRGLSVSADQALATGLLWFTSLCAFLPVIFANFVTWLRGDETPDEALYRLVRDVRRGAPQAPTGPV